MIASELRANLDRQLSDPTDLNGNPAEEHLSPGDVRVAIAGKTYDRADLERNELERSRIALRILKAAVGEAGLRSALAPHCARTEADAKQQLAASMGAWQSATMSIRVDGIKAQEFQSWWADRLKTKDSLALLGGHPEHFVINPYHEGVDGHTEVIETLGQYGEPWRVFLKRVEFDYESGKCLPPDFPIQPSGHHSVGLGGRIFTRDGSELMQVLSELRDTFAGMEVFNTLRFPAQMPRAVGEGQAWHFALEFMNWMTAVRAALLDR